MQWLAFAKQCLGRDSSPITWDLPAFAAVADALAAHPPYTVPLAHLTVVFHHAKVAEHLIPQALNGAVVALTSPAAAAATKDSSAGPSAEAVAAPCLAVGIVRSVDPVKGLLYMLTPAPMGVLKQATTLEVSEALRVFPVALTPPTTFLQCSTGSVLCGPSAACSGCLLFAAPAVLVL